MTQQNNYVPALNIKTVTISAGQTVSAAIETGGATLLGVYSPNDNGWVTADLTFLSSPDGVTYTANPITSPADDIYSLANVIKDQPRYVEATALAGFEFLKIKSSVTQTSTVTLTLAFGPVIAQQNIG